MHAQSRTKKLERRGLVQVDYVEAIFQLPEVCPPAGVGKVNLDEPRCLRVEDPWSSMLRGHLGSLHHGADIFQLIARKLRDQHFFLYGTTSDIHFFLARKILVERRRVSLPKNK